MKVHRWVLLIVISLFLGGILPNLADSSDPEEVNRQALSDLLTELEQKIEDADKRMVAHPKFLEELRALVDKFQGRLRAVFLKEDFSDGDYTENPSWVVDSGRFQMTPSKRLWSRITAERSATTPSRKEKSDVLGVVLTEIMRSAMEKEGRKEGKKESAPAVKEASIHTLAQIGPAFEVDLVLVSESQWGSMEIVLLGGEPAIPRYRMVYHAAPSADRPIQIVRERGSRSYLIESAVQYPALDDGVTHRLQWVRDFQGQMRVLVDGKEVLSTVELFYKTEFSGIALVNRGGTYEWGPIQILEASRE
jgi:hypothetical protein